MNHQHFFQPFDISICNSLLTNNQYISKQTIFIPITSERIHLFGSGKRQQVHFNGSFNLRKSISPARDLFQNLGSKSITISTPVTRNEKYETHKMRYLLTGLTNFKAVNGFGKGFRRTKTHGTTSFAEVTRRHSNGEKPFPLNLGPPN